MGVLERDQLQQATKTDNKFVYKQDTKGSGGHESWNGNPMRLSGGVGTM
jgi:hypothetical protein